MHGALYEAGELARVGEAIGDRQRTHAFDFPGHGSAPFPTSDFSIELFAEATLREMEQLGVARVSIFGYSMGGYVGLWLARHHPEKIDRVMTLGTKIDWHPEGAAREVAMLDPEMIDRKVPEFGRTLRKRHGEGRWQEVLGRTATMMTNLGDAPELSAEDFAAIERPVRMMVGDRDRMVTIEETLGAWRLLPQGELAILPNTPHPLEKVDQPLLLSQINHFFSP